MQLTVKDPHLQNDPLISANLQHFMCMNHFSISNAGSVQRVNVCALRRTSCLVITPGILRIDGGNG